MKSNVKVVALGASAGGLEPLEQFFETVNSNSHFVFVVIQHLAPDHKSVMDELLARHTSLPIEIIKNGTALLPGKVYLNPPKKTVEIKNNSFVLVEKPDHKLSFPISSFFRSLADHSRDNACAIILSGTCSDGSDGLKDIKEHSGLVLVQDPKEAKFNGMPNNAISTGLVDKVCSIKSMMGEVHLFFEHLMVLDEHLSDDAKDQSKLTDILNQIKRHTEIDFTRYKLSTLTRRVNRRISLLEYAEMDSYLTFLSKSPEEAQHLAKELLIGVTRFFRDEDAFNALRDQVIPLLVKQNLESKTLRIWVPACSSGEEAYTIAILIKDYLRKQRLQFDVNIFATDLDKQAIKNAGHRVFPESIVNEVPLEYLNTYFQSQRSGFSVVKEIRDMIVFSAHNLIQDPPFNKIDLISCRNFLIYINDQLQQEVFSLFQYALKTDGILFLGSSESLGKSHEEFVELNKKYKIYQNKENKPYIQRPHLPKKWKRATDTTAHMAQQNVPMAPAIYNSGAIIKEIQHALIQEYAPDALVVDQNFNLLYSSGNAHRWLTVPVGGVSNNLLNMLPDEIAFPLEVVALQVIQKKQPMTLSPIEATEAMLPFLNGKKTVSIQVQKKYVQNEQNVLLITFEPETVNKKKNYKTLDLNKASKEKISILERELRMNRETLQTTIEELESSNEELQSANEELQSSNEELESVNEELYTVNSENQSKNHELSLAKDDLENLIQSTDIALLFLDTQLNIRRFTPALKLLLELMPHDIGRNISHFRGKIQLENLLEHVEDVMDSQSPFESRLEDIKGKQYMLKITPFRAKTDEIQGVVLIFIDLTQTLKDKQALRVSDQALESLKQKHQNQTEILELISENIRDMIGILDVSGQIEYCTTSGTEVLGIAYDKIYKTNLIDLIAFKEEKKRIREILQNPSQESNTGLLSFRIKKNDGQIRWVQASFKKIIPSDTTASKLLVTVRDIHNKKLNELELQKMSLIAEQTKSAVIITDPIGKITFVNEAFEKLTGYLENEVLDKTPGSLLQGEESDPEIIKHMAKAIKRKQGFDVSLINYNKSGNKYLVNVKAEPLYDFENKFLGFFSIQNDITSEQDYLMQVNKLNQIIKDQNIKLMEVNKSLEDFAYIASHDLKAPVRNIRGLIDMIMKKGDRLSVDKRNEIFQIIKESSLDINRLVDNLLEYSRTGTVKESKEAVNIGETLEQIKAMFELDIQKLRGSIQINNQVDTIEVYPSLFKRLFSNMVSNAIKYRSEHPPKIQVNAIQNEDSIIFEVIDNGIGIESRHHENIFKIFNTLNPNKDSNGIGLSVCKKIVELHHGKISLTSELGRGTTFIIEIPREIKNKKS